MSAADIIALCTGIAGIITAVAALVGQLRHQADPNAHDEHQVSLRSVLCGSEGF